LLIDRRSTRSETAATQRPVAHLALRHPRLRGGSHAVVKRPASWAVAAKGGLAPPPSRRLPLPWCTNELRDAGTFSFTRQPSVSYADANALLERRN